MPDPLTDTPERAETSGRPPIPGWLFAVFTISGFAALIYQVVWQRALFVIYGIHVEAVTIVVTAFMLGLGLGSLAGGVLSKRAKSLLVLFGAVELAIGLFGILSLALFDAVGQATMHLPAVATATLTFLLLLVPTLLMGATLPLLTAWAVQRSGNVGRSVGGLYFVNTLGSALAAFAAVLVILGALGMQGSVYAAAFLNALAGLIVLLQHGRSARA